MTFFFNDLSFLKDEIFNNVYSIKIYRGILNDILELSLKRFPNLNYIELQNNIIEGIKNINFLSNSSLHNLKILDLDSNKIEDISIFTKEKNIMR